MKFIITALVCCSLLYGGIEVIELSERIPDEKELSWFRMANGALYIDDKSIYIPVKNTIFVQSRMTPEDVYMLSTQIKDYQDFTIMRVLPVEKTIYFNLILGNGRFYLAGIEQGNAQVFNLVERHGFPGRMLFQKNVVYVGGLFWTHYGKYLDKYDNSRGEKVTVENKRKFDHLFELQKGFTLSGYDNQLMLIDSINIISRTGENAKSFMSLYLPQPYDISESGEIFMADNEKGYLIKSYNEKHDYIDQFRVANDNFKMIPEKVTAESAKKLKSTQGSYSAIYALYEKDDYIISSFYQSAVPPQLPEPPYYYDISTKEGKHLISGYLKYPIVGEDESEKVYFYKKVEGGWFERDRIFIIGMSIKDIIEGKASSEVIDNEIVRFIKSGSMKNVKK